MPEDRWYAIVQHDAGVRGNIEFKRCVMEYSVERWRADEIEARGGLVFPSYDQAARFCDKANYPPDHRCGIIANVAGKFHPSFEVDGLPIYLPVRVVTG